MLDRREAQPISEFGRSMKDLFKALSPQDVHLIVHHTLLNPLTNGYFITWQGFSPRLFIDYTFMKEGERVNAEAFLNELQKISTPNFWMAMYRAAEVRNPQSIRDLLTHRPQSDIQQFAFETAKKNTHLYLAANTLMGLAALKGSGFSRYVYGPGTEVTCLDAVSHIATQFSTEASSADELLERMQQLYPVEQDYNDQTTAIGALFAHDAFYKGASTDRGIEIRKCAAIGFTGHIYDALGYSLRSPDYQRVFQDAVTLPTT